MIIKQLIKSIPIALKAEANGKDIYFSFVFLGASFAKFRLTYPVFIGLRNIIEEVYQHTLGSYKSQSQANFDAWPKDFQDYVMKEAKKRGIEPYNKTVEEGATNLAGLQNVRTSVPKVVEGVLQR